MKQMKNFCVFAAALGMVFGGIGLATLCFYRPETAAVLGGSLLLCGAAAFLAYRFLLRFAPRTIAGKQLDRCIKADGMAWLIAYDGNENIWRETPETEEDEETNNSGVPAKLAGTPAFFGRPRKALCGRAGKRRADMGLCVFRQFQKSLAGGRAGTAGGMRQSPRLCARRPAF